MPRPVTISRQAWKPSTVPAVRETSVIFGAVLGAIVLKEGFGLRRMAASVLVVGGIVLLALLR